MLNGVLAIVLRALCHTPVFRNHRVAKGDRFRHHSLLGSKWHFGTLPIKTFQLEFAH
jgi:hypothetical protein